ncbi:homocysteine S-methyltransferase family protein [Avibacterium paragallinarum]|uniref:homocysteine S-methyltransferase family protein n=1 Tax=Avibacterium paragallinarum TaxID=728 RepID=UPI00021AD357|nr:homocysteine S-methyltransferase family protein [Avibacterium paragallinarum]AZI14599.1 homocysteine S-methyltransferase family protein [Avibacterium paragallinarum]QJE10110.1 homocysteine S-methyltransferase family protein [Avibacterium paragallinarum]QJE12304.1 homocysteine S-methyltransferase family protein [Avibacterium paragallinarum]QJE14507.1 homocysteine S-methyltransferase family protein [Avibacterium paragallinarum]QJE16706.1 homocysteine S-methyltransferase family protein [Avibac
MTMTILDGGMSRELMRLNAPFRQPEWSALALYESPQAVQQVHEDFIANGAEVITTNSYAVVPFHIGEQRFVADGKILADLAGRLAKSAVQNSGKSVRIAGSLPPLFGSYRPDLFQPERVKEVAQPIIDGLSPYVDLWLCETQSAIIEPQSIKPLLPDDRPFWVSFTLQDEAHNLPACLRSGESVQSAVQKMIELGVSAILFNCCQPEVIEQALTITRETLQKHGALHIQTGAYANAFAPQGKEATANEGLDEVRQDLDPQAYLAWAKKWQQAGATIIGGCCGIGLAHIQALSHYFKPQI